jgi:acetyl esterase/lipase
MKRSRALCIAAVIALLGSASAAHAQSLVIPLWSGAAPGSESWTQDQLEYLNAQGEQMVRNVVHPTLTAYLPSPALATGTAIIIAPGGGFLFHSWETEGTRVAEWFQKRGVAAFVLKYRLMNSGSGDAELQAATARLFANIRTASGTPDPGGVFARDTAMARVTALATEDGRQAVRLVRQRAAEWGIAPDRIGLMGFSAGGIVTAGVALEHDAASRPSFVAPIYSVMPAGAKVPADAPPMFDLVASDDALASGPSLALFTAYRAAGRPAELHVYSKGGHGFGLKKQQVQPIDFWIDRLGEWMQAQGLMTKAAP